MAADRAAPPQLQALRQRLDRYPADRFPVRHATTRFHLGVLHLQMGDPTTAIVQLTAAAANFEGDALASERAKTSNMLGIAHRETGDLAAAAECFTAAAAAFSAVGDPAPAAAATFNRGLVAQQRGQQSDAVRCFTTALEGFESVRAPLQASAAARELGVCMLSDGDVDAAIELLGRAIEHADAGGDAVAVGAAANALGLALLAGHDHAGAASAFERAAGAHPRQLRPAEHAMALANLALALEDRHLAAAAVAARQAAGIRVAAVAVVEQASAVLDRLDRGPSGAEDLLAVLDDEPASRWADRWRAEHPRLLDADTAVLADETRAFLEGALARPTTPEHLEAWLDAVLDLPPRPLEGLLAALLLAVRDLDETRTATVRSVIGRVLPRFPIPQWRRLEEILNRLSSRLGLPGGWG